MSLASLAHFFAVLSFFFLVLCLLLCLVLGVWVVRKRGKVKGFSGFVNFFLGLLIFFGFINFFSLFAFLENRKPKKPTETDQNRNPTKTD